MQKTKKTNRLISKIWSYKNIIIGTVIGGGLFVLLLRQVSLKDVAESLSHISWEVFVLTVGLTVAIYIVRTMRLDLLFRREIPFWKLFFITCAHSLANNVLPARTGEFTLIFLAKKASTLSIPYITTSLLVVRVLDLFWALLIFILLLFGLPNISADLAVVRNVSLIVVLMLAVGVAVVFLFQDRVSYRLNSKVHNRAWKQKIAKIIVGGLEVIELLKGSPKMFFNLSGLTAVIWGLGFFSTFILSEAFGLNLSYFEVSVGTLFVVLTSILPVNSFLSIGVYEGAWTLAMLMLGVSRDLAITSGFTMHVIRLVVSAMLGLLGFQALRQLGKKQEGPRQ